MNSDRPDRTLVNQVQKAERLCYGKYRGIVVRQRGSGTAWQTYAPRAQVFGARGRHGLGDALRPVWRWPESGLPVYPRAQ